MGWLVRLAGAAGFAIGSLVLMGWLFDVPTLKRIWPGLALMQPNTALSIALAGLALFGLSFEPERHPARWFSPGLAAVVALIGLLTLAEYVLSVDLRIDRLLFGRAPGTDSPRFPGRMSWMSALCIYSLGSALLLLDSRTRLGRWSSQGFALTTTLFALLDLIGYAYGVRSLYLVGAYSTMALHTATALLLLGVGTLASRPEVGLMRRFLADDAGGWLLRNLLPLAVVFPLLTGGLRVLGEELGLFNPRFGSAVLVLFNILTLTLLLWWNAGRLSHLDADRRRAERAEREHELWFRTTLTSIGDAVIATDTGGRVTFINPAARELTGWSAEEAAGVPLEEVFRIVNESTRGPIESPTSRALREGVIVGLANHTVLIARDGSERSIDDSAAPIRDGDEIVGAVLVFRDVTEERRAKRELDNRERQFRTLADSIPQLVWMAEPDGHISWYNRRWYDYTGTTPEQMEGWGWSSVHDPDILPKVVERWKESLATGRPFEMVFPLKGADGIFRPFLTRIMPVEDDEGRVIRWFGTNTDVTEATRAEEELRQARSRLESTLSVGEIGTWEYDVANNVVTADSNLARIYGVTPEGAMEGPVDLYMNIIHPDDRARVLAAVGEALETGETYEAEYRVVIPDGSIRWVIARARIKRDASGQGVRMPGVVVDITGQKRAEEELRETRSRLESTLATGEVGTWEFDPVNDFVHADRNLAKMFGVSPEDADGGPLEAYTRSIHPEDLARVSIAIGEALKAGDGYEAEYRILGPDGAVRWVIARGRVERDASGRDVRMPGVVVDITPQKEAEARERRLAANAAEANERLQFALQAGRMGAWELDLLEGRMTCSDTCKANYGRLTTDPFTYEDLAGAVLDEDRARWRRTVEQAISQAADLDIEYRTRWPDGSVHWVCARASCTSDEAGRAIALSGVSFNIDERKRSEEALKDADRRKDEFLATLAHELRNPLAPIRNGLQIMKMAGDDRRLIDESRTLMDRQVTHMVRLIDDLMDISRITRNKLELRRERVELSTVVQSAVDASRPLIEAANHRLTVTLPTRSIFIDADVTRLSQVFSNLLNNAAKYTERGGEIALTAERQGSEAVVTVLDNGIGIPAEMLPNIFEMFTQVDRSLERAQGGLGIGLTLVRTLVEMHGGTVEAHSRGHAQGTEFAVRLPIVLSAPAQPRAPENQPGTIEPATSLRILVVDDNEDSGRTLARFLKLLGHEVHTANDGGQGLEAADRHRPELILLDIGMPVLNGYDVARAIRDRPWGRDIMIVALTGWGQEADRQRSKDAGIDSHLVKPVDPVILESLLAGVRSGAVVRS